MSAPTHRTRRPPAAYMLGLNGVSVEVPGWAADWLLRQTNFDKRRVALRGTDPVVDDVLVALRHAALLWRDRASDSASDSGSSLPAAPEVDRDSECADLLPASDAGGLIGITGRAVRQAIKAGRLPGQQIGDRWFVSRTDAENYRVNRAA